MMKKTILSTVIMAAAFSLNATAQQKVNLNLGDQTVKTVELGADDYIAFGRPAGVSETLPVDISGITAGKNSVRYTVETDPSGSLCIQMLLAESYLDMYLRMYMDSSIAEATDTQLKQAFRTFLLSGYGYGGYGPMTVNAKDGEENENGETDFIPGGQKYYIVAADLTQTSTGYALGENMTYKTVTTLTPGESTETLQVAFNGVDANGKASFSVTPSDGIKTLYLVLAKTKSIDQFVSVYGYDYLMFTQANAFTAEQWNALDEADRKWSISEENDYTFCALGVDNNGDWVKVQLDNLHIKPTADDACPTVDLTQFASGDGSMSAAYAVSSKTSAVSKAKLLVMKETDWDVALNNLLANSSSYTKPSDAWGEAIEQAQGTIDVTDQATASSKVEYSRTFTDEERGWYVIVLAVTDENGTTITRTSFHSHLTSAQPETVSHTYPTATASSAAPKSNTGKPQLKPMSGTVAKPSCNVPIDRIAGKTKQTR